MDDPPGCDWDVGSDARRLQHCWEAASAGPGAWSVVSVLSGGATCACGAPGPAAAYTLENSDTGARLDLELACLKALGRADLLSQAKARQKDARLLESAASARARLPGERGGPAPYSKAVIARARANGWITRAAASGYGESRAATEVVHRTLARVLEEGALLRQARPLRRVYRLVAPCDRARELGVRWHAGVPHWRGVEACAPADVRNRISAEVQLDWESLRVKSTQEEV